MKDMMEYKGFSGSVHYNDYDQVFYGKIEFIRSLITYEGTDVKSLQKDFKEAVDDYLELCIEQGIKPEIPFKGTFNVRVGSLLHRKAMMYAREHKTNLNTVVKDALEGYIVRE